VADVRREEGTSPREPAPEDGRAGEAPLEVLEDVAEANAPTRGGGRVVDARITLSDQPEPRQTP
jgi:hypothetical protein